MELNAELNYLRVSPRKMRRLINLVRRKGLIDSINILKFLKIANKKYLIKLLESIKANAKIKNPDINLDTLNIKEIVVQEGPRLKRVMPRARGRADVIKKRICHIIVKVSDEGHTIKKAKEKE
ncbi:MAG: 50S ribosomal protein L22 [bacterium]|nr:50S ribosomal protein L22 [bacterium]